MKSLFYLKVLPLVLAASFLVPRSALAAETFPPVDEQVGELKTALQTVVDETQDVVVRFSGEKKIEKSLNKAKGCAEKALAALDQKPHPKGLKKVASQVKKMGKLWDKALKAAEKLPPPVDTKKNVETREYLLDRINIWSGALLLAMALLITFLLSYSYSYFDYFTKGIEGKHIKANERYLGALGCFGMIGSFNPALFVWGAQTVKGFGLMASSMVLCVVLLSFVLKMQSRMETR
jgi:hypothetical protein